MAMDFKLPVLYSRADPKQRRLVREQYVREQGGLCYWCKQPLTGPAAEDVRKKKINWSLFPPGFRKHPVHLQHDHGSSMPHSSMR